MTETEVEHLSDFVRRLCAVETSSDEEDEEPRSGYFAFYQGKKARQAKKVRQNVPWGEVSRTTALVLRRARELAGTGEGHVWVRAYQTGETSPVEVCKVVGSLDDAEEPFEPSGSAVGDLAAALVRTTQMLLSDGADLRARLHQMHELAIQEREQLALAVFHGAALEAGIHENQMERVLAQLQPTIESLGPHVISAVTLWLTGGGGLPEEPAARTEAVVARSVHLAQELVKIAKEHGDQVVTAKRLEPLRPVIELIAPALGYELRAKAEQPQPGGE